MPTMLLGEKVLQARDVKWNAHPQFKGVEIAYLLTKRDDNVDMTCAMVRWSVGAEIPRHIHEKSDDILYIIKGKAQIWIDGVGDIPVSAGSFVRIPMGVLHHPHSVTEEVVAHDTWFPATV
jgi:mannose-6-phosphate isomerase-like protein (cupin superfamily)